MTMTEERSATAPTTKKRVRKVPPKFEELSPRMRARINELAPSVRNKITIQGPDQCWVHPVGVLAQTSQPDRIRKSLGKYVWQTFHPEDGELYTGSVGDPMTVSIQPLKTCVEGCVRPEHLTKMTSAERSHLGRPNGAQRYMGVVPHKLSGTFQARFHAGGEMYSGGYFPTEEQAAERYDSIVMHVDPDRPTNYSMGLIKTKPVAQPANERVVSSIYRGVFWNEPKSRWFARASIGGVQKHIGSYRTEEDAAEAYNQYVVDNGLDYPLNIIGID